MTVISPESIVQAIENAASDTQDIKDNINWYMERWPTDIPYTAKINIGAALNLLQETASLIKGYKP